MDNNIPEHRRWMYNRVFPNKMIVPEFIDGVEGFINYCVSLPQFVREGTIRCPCLKCKCCKLLPRDTVIDHLFARGFIPNYWWWINHGEINPYEIRNFDDSEPNINYDHDAYGGPNMSNDDNMYSGYEEMVQDAMGPEMYANFQEGAEEPPNAETRKFYEMLEAVRQPLWEGSRDTKLSAAVDVMEMKTDENLTQRSVDKWLHYCRKTNRDKTIDIPHNFYSAKKLVVQLGLKYERIHCCRNGCMLYWKDDAQLSECKHCNASRYVENTNNPEKWMHYLPLIPRLKRLYASMQSAPHMRWHSENRRPEGVMCHPSDGKAWKRFDKIHKDFAEEPRNIRLGLCSDGFNPFGPGARPYTCWPVFITPYNLPPEMCMTAEYIFLTAIIPGKRSPGVKIDVFLQPLIEELKMLWHGVEAYDVSVRKKFQLRAALMWTINDFPAYGMLSGWQTAGRLACPVCMTDTKAFYLPSGRKNSWFDCHRRWLEKQHPFRKNKIVFVKGRVENESPPRRYLGKYVHDWIKNCLKVTDGTFDKLPGYGVDHNWTKKSIFWDLPYWQDNLLPHNLDVMHIEKFFFDNIINTVMNTKATKDNDKAREDMAIYCHRPELEIEEDQNGNKGLKPKAEFTLTVDECKKLCAWVSELKMPDGYASNLSNCVDNETKSRLVGMKSHDCHVFLENLLPIALRGGLPDFVWTPLTEISLFFKQICSSTLSVADLKRMKKNVPIILCKLEKIFPPGFFNVMEHLIIHLIEEALLGGPCQYRWMYPFERNIGKCKRSVKQRNRVEGSICEAYLARETVHFCSYYFNNEVAGSSQLTASLSVFNKVGRATGKTICRYLTDAEMKSAALHVLLNSPEVEPTLRDFTAYYGQEKVDSHFRKWFKDFVFDENNGVINAEIRNLAWGPLLKKVKTWHTYFVNGFKFQIESHSKGKTINSGVWVRGHGDVKEYHGVLQEIIELEYPAGETVVLFKCKWYDPIQGTRVIKEGNIVEIHRKKFYTPYDPFVLARDVKQVYYVSYPFMKRDHPWMVVVKTKPKGRIEKFDEEDQNFEEDEAFQNETSSDVNLVVDNELHGNYLRDPRCIYEIINVAQPRQQGASSSRAPSHESESSTDDDTSEEERYNSNSD